MVKLISKNLSPITIECETSAGTSSINLLPSTGSMGIKRNRFLIRQPRIKRDSDTINQITLSPTATDTIDSSPTLEPLIRHRLVRSGDAGVLLSVPPRFERHASEPSRSPHLLSVPSTSSGQPFLVKQHSHPLLPSQLQSNSSSSHHSGFTLHRQYSHPLSSTSPITPLLLSDPTGTYLPDVTTEDDSNVCFISTNSSFVGGPAFYTTASATSNLLTVKKEHLTENVIVPPPITKAHSSGILLTETLARTSSPTLRVKVEELQRSASSPQSTTRELSLELVSQRSSHCPILRPGPALGCNFCWNTIDAHGRILRRKTKYHCPECQTNLCIVPCFQEYHERQSTENQSKDNTTKISASALRNLPKTESI